MIQILWIRHGMTVGNKERCYIGRTDENVCIEGVQKLRQTRFPDVMHVYVSPMQRCIQTADILFPEKKQTVIDDLRECDFGDFEGKNFKELQNNKDYQEWLDSKASMPFPNGESKKDFCIRCVHAYYEILTMEQEYMIGIHSHTKRIIAAVVHGGTIMAIFSQMASQPRSYYDWNIPNGCGILTSVEESKLSAIEYIR